MAAFKVLLVLAIAALAAVSAQLLKIDDKFDEKKDMMMMMKYADDDGSYWPGKYDRSLKVVPTAYHSVIPAVAPVHTMPVMSAMPSVLPYAYSHMPVSRSIVF